MWGILPSAGSGTRIQPLAFSKELLPVGSQTIGVSERPRAVSEYLLDRMRLAGADKICFIIAPGKSDILQYYGTANPESMRYSFVVQPAPNGLCDALFQAVPLIHPSEQVLVGLPDTVWFPEEGFCALRRDALEFLLFPVEHPERFDAVLTSDDERVERIDVKHSHPETSWVWGAFRMPGRILHGLHELWLERNRKDEFFGTLVNEWIARGGEAYGIRAGTQYMDVGTLEGYREAIRILSATIPKQIEEIG